LKHDKKLGIPPNTGPKLATAMSVCHCQLSVTVSTRSIIVG